MILSKVLKKKNKRTNKYTETLYSIFIQSWLRPILRLIDAIKRFFVYGYIGLSSSDHDYVYLFKIIRFKLLRLNKALSNGLLKQDKRTTQSISICIKLLDRLIRDDYFTWQKSYHKKWGYPDFYLEPTASFEEKTMYQMIDKRKLNWSNKDINLEKNDFLLAFELDEKHKQRDSRILFKLMNKYHNHWWC